LNFRPSNKSTRAGFGDGLLDVAKKFAEIVTLDADLRHSVQTLKFAQKYPDRAFNLGIAEQNLITVAAGLARVGKIPFAASFAVFVTGLGFNQIRQSVCYSQNNVKIVGSHAGMLTGEDGATHQALEDLALMRSLPNLKVYCPADYYEARALVSQIAAENSPCYLRLGRQNLPVVYNEKFRPKKFGFDLLRHGKTIAIFATGTEVPMALQAAEILKLKKISAAVVNISTIKPLPSHEILSLAQKFELIFTAEDHSVIGGLGSAVAEILAESNLKTRLIRLGMLDRFGESGTSSALLKKFELDGEGLARKIIMNCKL
jgi:transketolase